jgi:hypothetical protein
VLSRWLGLGGAGSPTFGHSDTGSSKHSFCSHDIYHSQLAEFCFHKSPWYVRFHTQNLLTPLQSVLADGCHLNRDTGATLQAAGFSSLAMTTGRVEQAYLLAPHVWGTAVK